MYLDKTLDAVTLSVRANGTYEPFSSEAWGYAGQMTLLGMMMVFSVLAILWGVLTVFKFIFASNKKTKSVKEIKEVTEKNTAVTEAPASASDDAELVAVITAAVAAYMSSEQETEVSPNGFRVVSFRKASGGRSWNSK